MKNNPNWTYADHPQLGMKYAIKISLGKDGDKELPVGTCKTEDKTPYLPSELKILGGVENITPGLHMVKRVFEGEVVRYENNI
jgi:hypothetical protein